MGKYIRKLGSYYLHSKSAYYFISFPKSGRTWIKSFLANYYSSYLKIPLFYNFSPIIRLGKRRGVPRIIFTHPTHRGVEAQNEQFKYIQKIADKKVILLIRDPERVIFTYYHRLLKRMNDSEVAAMSIQQFMREPSLGIPQIIGFMNHWYESRGTFKDFILIRYEDFVANPEKEFERLLKYLKTPVIEKDLQIAISSSVDTTRKIEQSEFLDNGSLHSDMQKGSQYFESKDMLKNSNNELGGRYDGDEAEYDKCFTAEDREYIAAEVARLFPELRYC